MVTGWGWIICPEIYVAVGLWKLQAMNSKWGYGKFVPCQTSECFEGGVYQGFGSGW